MINCSQESLSKKNIKSIQWKIIANKLLIFPCNWEYKMYSLNH